MALPTTLPTEIFWEIAEYEKHDRNWKWYLIASIITLFLIIWSIMTANFLFTLIIIMGGIITIINDRQAPAKVQFLADAEGVSIGSKFYDYDEFKHFSVIYKPRQNTKNLYLTHRNVLKNRLSIPLEKQDPLTVRNFLLQYLEEDLERTDEPLSENISKLLKL